MAADVVVVDFFVSALLVDDPTEGLTWTVRLVGSGSSMAAGGAET